MSGSTRHGKSAVCRGHNMVEALHHGLQVMQSTITTKYGYLPQDAPSTCPLS